MTEPTIDPIALIRPRRRIEGISAILLPFDGDGRVDWPGFRGHVERTADAGLIPAVNMDTGFVNLIDPDTQGLVLSETRTVLSGLPFVAGAFIADGPGDRFDLDAYRDRIDAIQAAGGTPIVFPSFGLSGLDDDGIFDAHSAIGRHADRFLAFELVRCSPRSARFTRRASIDASSASPPASAPSIPRSAERMSGGD